jgi:hypothetical protein
MILTLKVAVPSSADAGEVQAVLARAAALGQGVTITTSERYQVDVDLVISEPVEVAR